MVPAPDVSPKTADPTRGHTIDAMPLNAAICEPARGGAFGAGPNWIRGYAISGDRAVVRVDISGDGGRSWTQADLKHDPEAPFAWTFWAAELHLPWVSTSSSSGPGTWRDRGIQRCPTTPGTTRAISVPAGIGCG
ncbi:hypothetical protein [Methylobacterium sp. P5_C11]